MHFKSKTDYIDASVLEAEHFIFNAILFILHIDTETETDAPLTTPQTIRGKKKMAQNFGHKKSSTRETACIANQSSAQCTNTTENGEILHSARGEHITTLGTLLGTWKFARKQK